MVIWFSGISGSGKTTLAKKIFQELKKKSQSTIFLDGDKFREIFKNDLGYTLKDRNTNADRITRFVKEISDQKINVVVSANLTNSKYRFWCKNNIKDYCDIYIEAKKEFLIKRDYKGLYKNAIKNKIKNVVGIDLPFSKPLGSFMYIKNDSTKAKYFKNIKLIFLNLKKSKIKFF